MLVRFCDGDDINTSNVGKRKAKGMKKNSNLACLEELVTEIDESSKDSGDPWKDFPALRLLLKDRADFDSVFPTIEVRREYCKDNEKSPCSNHTIAAFGPRDVMSGTIFDRFKVGKINFPLRIISINYLQPVSQFGERRAIR